MSTKRAGATCLRMHAHYTKGPGFPRITPPGSGVLAQAVQSYSILAPANINASSYPAPYSKNKGRSGTGQLSLIFKCLRLGGKSVFKITVETAPTGRQQPIQSDPQTQKRAAFAGGRKTGNRG